MRTEAAEKEEQPPQVQPSPPPEDGGTALAAALDNALQRWCKRAEAAATGGQPQPMLACLKWLAVTGLGGAAVQVRC
jgi:hypothetical protein